MPRRRPPWAATRRRRRVNSLITKSEHGEQSAFFDVVRLRANNDFRYRLIWAIPNGAKLPFLKTKKGKRYSPQAMWLKAEGLTPGVPDIIVAYPRTDLNIPGLFMEVKVGNSKPTKEQIEIHRLLRVAGYRVEIPRSFEQMLSIVEQYFYADPNEERLRARFANTEMATGEGVKGR